ncbi:MAG: carbamoyltransferase HypF [Anaerovoracaceae bacterium]
MKKITVKIKLWGIVQGVGFRPFVAKIADRLQMKGEVLNIGGLVEIVLTDIPSRIEEFTKILKAEKPVPAEIVYMKQTQEDYREFQGFTILDSGYGDDEAAMIPADLAICPDCLAELRNHENPRYAHSFISCMVCGPRYTVIDSIPYDRENTTMIDFPMCNFCSSEYGNLHDRRYHAQTISCHDCGPMLEFSGEAKNLPQAAAKLKTGAVIAFKSVGGYNLVCDPANPISVRKLRKMKNRDSKPFALMFKDIDQVKEYCNVSPLEETLLQSSARPIILLEHKPTDDIEISKSRFIGAFLPSMGAQYLLLDHISPLIFTSANPSSMPMIKDDEAMMGMDLSSDCKINTIISNKRRIKVRMDDSVVRVIDGQPQMIRRSKGYAPVPLYIPTTKEKLQIFATGGQLKNSFSLSKGPFAYVSQYFGDMDTIENQDIYRENLNRMSKLFRIKPDLVICDLHPLYFTTKLAVAYAKKHDIPLIKVQHHHAHVASVMAEHNLDGQVIGVSFDGTGYGTDAKIWGGEFLLCQGAEFQRKSHLKYVKMLGGDSSMKEAWKSAVSYIYAYENGYLDEKAPENSSAKSKSIPIDISQILEFAKSTNWEYDRNCKKGAISKKVTAKKALSMNINTIQSSSMGRLFDGVSALLGIKEYNDYEGQCAIMLEDAAAAALAAPGQDKANDLALAFHRQIAQMILKECIAIGQTDKVALTGGVFQNKILMEESLKLLRENGFQVYYNISVSPNDGGIPLGQTYIGLKGGRDLCQSKK